MKKIEPVKIIVILMILVTAMVAAFYLTTRPAVPKGALSIESGGQTVELPLKELNMTNVQGTVVNGKGEERTIEAEGILLSEVLLKAGIQDFSEVTVTADDAYSAVVTAEEIAAPDTVYLIRQDKGGMQLIVFGDMNSKRNVSDVKRLSVR